MHRKDIEVVFKRNSADAYTGQSWVNGQRVKLPDQQALRQINAGNAEYTTKTEAKKVSAEDQKEKIASAKK